MGSRRPECEQPLDVVGLVLGVQVEVHPRTSLHLGGLCAQRDVRSLADAWAEDRPVIFRRLAWHVVQSLGPERELGWEVVDAKDNRTDAHTSTVARSTRRSNG